MLSFGFTNTTATTNTSALSFGGITTPAPKINAESNSTLTPGGFGPNANQTQQHFAVPKPQVASTPSINVAVVKTPVPQIAATPSTNNPRKRPSSSSTSSASSTSGSTNSGILESRLSFVNNNGNHGNHGSNGSSDKRRRTTTSVLNKRLNPNAVKPSQHSSLLTNVSRTKRATPAPAFITNPSPSNRRRLDINGAYTSSSSPSSPSSSSSSLDSRSNFSSSNTQSESNVNLLQSLSTMNTMTNLCNLTQQETSTPMVIDNINETSPIDCEYQLWSAIKSILYTAAVDKGHSARPQIEEVFEALRSNYFTDVTIELDGYKEDGNWYDWWLESDQINRGKFVNLCASIFEG